MRLMQQGKRITGFLVFSLISALSRESTVLLRNVPPYQMESAEGIEIFERLNNCLYISALKDVNGNYSVEVMPAPSLEGNYGTIF